MFRKTVALVTAVCFTVCNLGMLSPAWADEEEEASDEQFTRTISSSGSDGWSIVDVRRIDGTQIILSPAVGSEIDLEESNRYALFQGGTTYTSKVDLSLLKVGVSGFQSAVFMKQESGRLALKIEYRSRPRIETRLIPIKSVNELR